MAYLYPYGDTQQLNLDWLIEQWNEVKSQIDGSLQAEIDRVEAAITDLLTARDEAVAAQTAAQASAQAAAGSASTASGAASTATAQAQAAAASTATAGAHASNAQGYAATAQQEAQAAHNDAAAAAVSAGNAHNDAQAAHTDALAAAQDAADAHADALAAAQDADDAHADALAAQAVLDSIPADYTALSAEVTEHSNTLGEVQKHPFNSIYFPIVDKTHNISSSSNQRTINIKHNHIKTTSQGYTGSTFFTCLLNGDGHYVGSNDSSVISNLTENDFQDIYIPENYGLFVDIDYIGEKVSSTGTHGAGTLVVATMNKTTQEIKLVGIGSFGLSNLKTKAVSLRANLLAELPEIYENQNICFLYRSRYADISEEWSVSIYETPFTYSAANTYGTATKPIAYQMPMFTANKNLVVNDIVLIGNNLYIITAPISIGEQVINGTNAQYTTVGNLITQILNS